MVTFVINDLAALQRWRHQLRRIVWSRNLPAVEFQLQQISDQQNQIFSALANEFKKACGCASSGFFMAATVIWMIATQLSGNQFNSIKSFNSINFTHILSAIGTIVLAAFFGKLLGLLWARWRLLRLATTVNAIFKQEQ